jgi:glycerophosphoryl diester phosphodiesterase
MNVIAHRGDHTVHPENTLPAFQAALEAGADGFEFDVRLTADLVPVVFHYVTLVGTTGEGLLCDHSHDDIRQLRVLAGETHAGGGQEYGIPSLQEVLATFGGKTYLELHVQPAAPETITIIGRMLNDYRHIWPVMELTSYEPAMLLGFQDECSGLATDLLFPRSEAWMTPEIVARLAVEKASLANARAVHLHPDQLTPDVVAYVRAHGLTIHCWDVNSRATAARISALGIEQFTTDNIHLFLG